MAEINQESGVFGGISFENNMNQSGVVENAGTIRNEALPVKTGFWQKFKAFWLQDIDWNQEISFLFLGAFFRGSAVSCRC